MFLIAGFCLGAINLVIFVMANAMLVTAFLEKDLNLQDRTVRQTIMMFLAFIVWVMFTAGVLYVFR